MVSHNAVAMSAPGKVLLAGGYLVLDRNYTGLVFGLDARIHVVIQDIPTRNGVTLSEITVQSPQFEDAVWEYGYRLAERDGGICVTPLRVIAEASEVYVDFRIFLVGFAQYYGLAVRTSSSPQGEAPYNFGNYLNLNRNIFTETALSYALSYIASASTPLITPAAITILADNDYYSTPADLSHGNAAPTSRFHNFGVPLSKAHKTGLGSSAALVTAFTAALLTYYLPKEAFDLSTELSKRRLHNLAQATHCAAQGKVGSGFDVASAVYGSCLYRRFSPDILSDHVEPGMSRFATQLKDIVDETGKARLWDTEVRQDEVKVTKGLRLVMCDVSCGSKTPGMVKKVLAWRKEKPEEAHKIWSELQRANEGLAAELKSLAESSNSTPDYSPLKKCFQTIRTWIRAMSAASDVPIEPPAQTELLNACDAVPGVIGGVVPGAGGYDAISLLVEDKNERTIDELAKLFSKWQFSGGEKQSTGRVSMLGVREEMQGVRSETVSQYLDALISA